MKKIEIKFGGGKAFLIKHGRGDWELHYGFIKDASWRGTKAECLSALRRGLNWHQANAAHKRWAAVEPEKRKQMMKELAAKRWAKAAGQ